MRRTVLFVWREVGGTRTSEGEAAARRAARQFTVARRVVRPDAPTRAPAPCTGSATAASSSPPGLCLGLPALCTPRGVIDWSLRILFSGSETQCYNSCLFHWSANPNSGSLLDRLCINWGKFHIQTPAWYYGSYWNFYINLPLKYK